MLLHWKSEVTRSFLSFNNVSMIDGKLCSRHTDCLGVHHFPSQLDVLFRHIAVHDERLSGQYASIEFGRHRWRLQRSVRSNLRFIFAATLDVSASGGVGDCPGLVGFTTAHAEDAFRVGVMSGDGEVLMEQVATQAKMLGLPIKIIPFSDYLLPNEALNHGELDANAFQHQPYLDNQVKTRGYHIVSVAFTVVAPIGLYSRNVKSPAELPRSAKIGIPNDPSNGGRGLNLLASLGVISLRAGAGISPTVLDITGSPKDVRIVELDAGIIARSLDDLDAAIVNTDWILKSGLGLDRRIATEPVENNPYRNVIAIQTGHENDKQVQLFIAAYHSDAVRTWIIQHYQGRQLPAW